MPLASFSPLTPAQTSEDDCQPDWAKDYAVYFDVEPQPASRTMYRVINRSTFNLLAAVESTDDRRNCVVSEYTVISAGDVSVYSYFAQPPKVVAAFKAAPGKQYQCAKKRLPKACAGAP